MLGCALAACPERAREASPLAWVSPDDPPFHIVHGTADCTVPPLQSRTLHDALVAADVESSLTWIEGGGHGGAQWSDAIRLPALEAFLDRNVRDAGETETWLVPAVARTPGAGGTSWTTSLTLANPAATSADIAFRFLGHDSDGTAGPARSLRLEAGASATYDDVLAGLFGLAEGWGSLLVSSSGPGLVVVAQTSTPGNGGTYGQAVPAFGPSDLVTGVRARSVAGVREDAAFRTNLVLASAVPFPVDVEVALVDSSGRQLGRATFSLPPLGMTQATRVVRLLGVEAPFSGRLLVSTSTPGGELAAYASLIDAATGDPRTLLPR
jgi:hypothetical protein